MVITRPSPVNEDGTILLAERGREHALFLNLLVATAPAIPKLIAAALSGSVTLLTSGMKTINEATAILIAWVIARKIARGDQSTYDYGMGKFENLARMVTGVSGKDFRSRLFCRLSCCQPEKRG